MMTWENYLSDRQHNNLYVNALVYMPTIKIVRKIARAGDYLLEAGCGSGRSAMLMSDMGYRVAGLDLSLQLLERIAPGKSFFTNLQLINGDIGHIYSVDHNQEELVVDLWDGRLVKYQKADARELSLAYALTVHRSQGSEIPCVVLVLHDSHFILLERQLFYTAVTRAKQLLVVVGTTKALSIASKTLSAKRRCTNLREKISEKLTASNT